MSIDYRTSRDFKEEQGIAAYIRRERDFNREGHLRTGKMNCNKCGAKLTEKEGWQDCWFCGPVCNQCGYGCFEKNEHCRRR